MANTELGTNHPLTRKAWSKKLFGDALKQTYVGKFIGSSANSLVMRKDDLKKDKGDRVRMGLRVQMTGDGVTGDATLEGNEESLVTYYDDLSIDQSRHAHRTAGRMTEQRAVYDIREEAKDALADWFQEKFDSSFFNAICGNTGAATGNTTGHNATVAPTSTRWSFSDGTHTTEASLSTTDYFQLTYIDRALAGIKVASPTIRPIKYKGSEYYVAFMHPYTVHRLRTDATAARVTWYDVQKSLIQGGDGESNGIFTGALGIYNNVIMHESTRVPAVTSNVRRTVICGAQAATLAFGNANDGLTADFVEKKFDYENQVGIAGSIIWGLKKSVFNSTDYATWVISTRDAAP